MIEFEFSGYACLPGSPMGECLDAAGVDASVGAGNPRHEDEDVAFALPG